ncbi:MAG: hypothetical protein L0332_08965 [Chloroflexi bacterium]|nr:hypothetical protein [Chloroflexota bacterium]MCI0575775.1 hypothetical protein [Chloroflexota bacterium]MCI0643618.1 hypothetical protein [Chloroflexota bacterium]MCI0726836.1 hypothetical protein [Chloroflexota bacterium]
MLKLKIFVSDDCWSSEESRRIAAETQARFADVEVMLIDLHSDERPPNVFAAPTYVLNERVISLGNPRREALWEQLRQMKNDYPDGGGVA